ncbi:hypothetical protein FSP39_017058 [Pinctada imbricata]|uniref:Uncharacterized protein n=1 Tax=Pinctada imbricata TaxID=66713 RepID=A0AA88XWX5_PINIB|nr:hypothetical protein FSP39_017058 [Pinctada imbricata]
MLAAHLVIKAVFNHFCFTWQIDPRYSLLATMREQTYGWYPSVKDVYKDRRMGAPNPYQIEAMYKFQKSKYYEPPHPPTPRPPNAFRPTPTPQKRPMSTMSSKSRSSGKDSSLQVRAKSAPIYDFKPVPRLQIPTPHQCWAMSTDETPYGVVEPTPTPPPEWPSPKPPFSSPTPSVSLSLHGEQGQDTRRDRIQSAVIRRERPTPPPRSVRSAGSNRKPLQETERSCPSRIMRPSCPTPSVKRVETPVPDEVRSPSPDPYDAELKKYGWRMEVHGDPYKIKPITKRLTYYVTCQEPEIESEGPKVHMENGETFFYNTIPRRPACFAIHKEWISETIHAKRMELQKREGIKHRWKNFAFVY